MFFYREGYINMVIRPLDKTLEQEQGISNAQIGKSLLRRMFAFRQTHCRACKKLIHFSFFYGMPRRYKETYNYGGFRNEVHCVGCHNESINKQKYCYFCHIAYDSPHIIFENIGEKFSYFRRFAS